MAFNSTPSFTACRKHSQLQDFEPEMHSARLQGLYHCYGEFRFIVILLIAYKALQNKRKTAQTLVHAVYIGEGGGSRTRVRKPLHTSLSERSQSFNIPSPRRRQTGFAAQ